MLLSAVVGAAIFSTILAGAWPFNAFAEGVQMESLTGAQLAFVWGYSIAFFFLQDGTKWILYRVLLHFDFEGIATSARLRDERAAALTGVSIDQRVDVLEDAMKQLTIKTEAIESLSVQVASLKQELSSMKK